MAWTRVGTAGARAGAVNASTYSWFGPGDRVTLVGRVLVVYVGVDNLDTVDGDGELVTNVTDQSGNTWNKAGEWTNAEGGAGAGITISAWYTRVTTELPANYEGKFHFRANVGHAAIICGEYTIDDTEISLVKNTGTASDTGAEAVSLSGLESGRSYAFFRMTGAEKNSFGFTPTTGWTATGSNHSGNTAEDNSAFCSGECLFSATVTEATSDPDVGVYAVASTMFVLQEGPLHIKMLADPGTYALTGNAAAMGPTMSANDGSFALTGNAADLIREPDRLRTQVTEFSLTGNAIKTNLNVPVGSGAYTHTGNNAKLGPSMQGATASYVISGSATLTPGPVPQRIVADAGTFTFTGIAASLFKPIVLKAEKGFCFLGGPSVRLLGGSALSPSTAQTDPDEGYRYKPALPPNQATPEETLEWALRELEKAGNVINNISEGHVTVAHKEPEKPRDGMIRKADGVNWNPGAGGAGYYAYDEATATWLKLG